MLQLSLITFIVFPILSIILVGTNYIISNKYKKIYAIIIALFFALVAYYMNPPKEFDLYRHHLLLNQISRFDLGSMFEYALQEKEILRVIIMYCISQLDNWNFLQFTIVFCGYSIILLMLADYVQRNEHNNKLGFIMSVIYILFTAINFVDFASGLWFILGIIVFSLGIYMEYVLKKSKKICFIIYLITPLIHISLLLPLLVKIVYSFIYKEKVDKKKIIFITIVFCIPQFFVTILSNVAGNELISALISMYEAYFMNGSQFNNIYGGINFVFAIIRIIILLYVLLKTSKEESLVKINDIAKIILIMSAVLIVNAGVFARFISLAEIIAFPLLIKFFSNRKIKKNDCLIYFAIFIFMGMMTYLKIKKIIDVDYDGLFSTHILDNIVFLIKNR